MYYVLHDHIDVFVSIDISFPAFKKSCHCNKYGQHMENYDSLNKFSSVIPKPFNFGNCTLC